jgi:hypothetical protein
MTPLDPNTGLLPPTLRALALGLLVETVVPMLTRSGTEGPEPPDQDEGSADAKAKLWQDLRGKCDELSSLVLRADDPEEAAAYVLGYLPKHFEYLFELLGGQRRGRVLDTVGAAYQAPHRNGKHDTAPA